MSFFSPVEPQNETAKAYKARDFAAFERSMEEWLRYTITTGRGAYYGQALHMYHTYHGLFTLEADRVDEAKLHLLRSAGVPRSPAVFSFGPNMRLAQQLAERGERAVVYQYFALCKLCWWFPFRWYHTSRWRRSLLRGEVPDFKANLYYHMGESSLWFPKKTTGT